MTQASPVPPITKWPFYVADAVCLLTALVIGLRSATPLAHLFVFLLVVAGGILLMYPFVKEYGERTRFQRIDLREELEAQRAMLLSIATDSQAASRGVVQIAEQIRQELARHQTAFGRFETGLISIEEAGSRLHGAGTELSKHLQSKQGGTDLAPIKQELAAFREEEGSRLQECLARLESLETANTADFKSLVGQMEVIKSQLGKLGESIAAIPPAEAPAAPRAKSPRGALMQKALSQTQDAASAPAVSRIIGIPKAVEIEAETQEAPVEEISESAASPVEEAPVEKLSEKELIVEPVMEDAPSAEDEVAVAVELPKAPASMPDLLGNSPLHENFDKVLKAKEAAKAARQAETEGKRPFEEAAQDTAYAEPASPSESISADPLEALADATPVRPKSHRKVRGQRASLTAKLLIGIGNKPYVRGEGPGLSPDKGVPMEFVEIGLWRWVAPAETAYANVRVYRNDEVPATNEAIQLAPGDQAETAPLFPSA